MSRRLPLRRAVVVLAALALGAGLVTSSAATLGGLGTESLGGVTADVRRVAAVELDWNVGVQAVDFSRLRNVAVRDIEDALTAGSLVEVTATDGVSTCDGAAATGSQPETLVTFQDCPLALLDLTDVHAIATSDGAAVVLQGNLGDVNGTIAAFSGDVVDPAGAASSYDTVDIDGVARLSSLRFDVPGVDPAVLDGARVLVTLTTGSGTDLHGLATIGGVGASLEAGPAVSVDLAAVLADLPRASTLAGYRLVLVTPHVLTDAPGAYAVTTAGAALDVVDPTPTPDPDPDWTIVPRPVKGGFVYRGGELELLGDGRFCQLFTVTNERGNGQWGFEFDGLPLRGNTPDVLEPTNLKLDVGSSGTWLLRSTQAPLSVGDSLSGRFCWEA